MSLGLVVLEKKLFTRTRTPTPQSDDIMSADIKIDIISEKIEITVSNIDIISQKIDMISREIDLISRKIDIISLKIEITISKN